MTEMNATEATEKKSLNFIEQAVENDLREGKNGGKVQTRFPPEAQLHRRDRRRRTGHKAEPRLHPFPAGAQRLPAHRSCQSHLSGFRDSCTLWWRM